MVLFSGSLNAQVSIGGYNVYYGSLHNHSNVSDGTGSPDAAYNYAKNTSQLDFFSLADHSGSIESAEWTTIKNAANTCNEDGVFTAFWGFEWTSSAAFGHVAVINTEDYCTTASPTNNFSGLCDWLNTRECVAFFNHPGREDDVNTEFSHFGTTPTSKLVGMELWNKADAFSMYYYNDGYYTNDGNKSYFDEALVRNWQIGASGAEDNHSGNWGNYCNYRMAVLANVKNRADIYAALQARRFFTTLDKNIGLSFKINGNEMGSNLVPGNYPLQIQASDGDGEIFTTIKLVKNGAVVSTWTPNSSTPNITDNLSCAVGDYFYVIITQADLNEAISSPIWCAGTNEPPTIAITSPANNATFNEPAIVSIVASASDDDGTVAKVEFYQGIVKIGEDLESPYTLDWTGVLDGTYVLTAVATDNLGAQGTSTPVTINVAAQGYISASSIIASGADDVEERITGLMYITSTDIELVYDASNGACNQFVGLRYLNPGIPGNSLINNAYIQFAVDEATTGSCSLVIHGEDVDNSPAFTTATFNVSARPQTTASVDWIPATWPLVGEAGLNQRTPDLVYIIQEIVNRPGYNSSSAVSLIITGNGTRTAKAFEVSASEAAKLVVIYASAPIADFEANVTTVQQGATVNFSDLSTYEPTAWSWSFPGGTTDENNAQNPAVVYNTPGAYSVTLTASNSAGSNTFTAVNYITVNEPGYCSSQSTNFSSEYISKFTLGTFVNTSSGSYYTDYTNLTISLQANKKYTVKVTPTFVGGKKVEYFKVWIDYNHDLDFDDAGENVVTGSKNAEISKIFTTPSNVTGTTRLRVAMKRVSYSGTCETFTYGEVEDYTVNFGSKSGEILPEEVTIVRNPDNAFKIYPNPATGILYVEKTGQENCVMEIYSLTGDLVMKSKLTETTNRVDIGLLKPGLYFIKCSDQQGITTRKLIIQ
jgi:PKD repeat protein